VRDRDSRICDFFSKSRVRLTSTALARVRRLIVATGLLVRLKLTCGVVSFELQPNGSGTRLAMTHDGFPSDMRAHLNGEMPEGGWDRQYFEPLRKYLG
jgi:hypothetical protein